MVFVHLSGRDVSVGQRVQVGCKIGTTGDAGMPGTPHLHVEAQLGSGGPAAGHPYFPTQTATLAVTKDPASVPSSFVPVTTSKVCIP